jgi:hypothetical protein
MKHSCLSFIHDCVIGFLSFYACVQLFLHACFSSGFFGGVFPAQNLPRRCCETREPPLQSPVFFDTLHQRYDMTLCVLHAFVHLVVELTPIIWQGCSHTTSTEEPTCKGKKFEKPNWLGYPPCTQDHRREA